MKDGRTTDVGFTAGVIAGAMVGAGLGLLLAPAAGADVRGGISDSVKRARTSVAKRLRALADRADRAAGDRAGMPALVETTHLPDAARRDLREVARPPATALTFHE